MADTSHESIYKMERSYSEMSIERVLPPPSALTPTPRDTDNEPTIASDEEEEENEEEEDEEEESIMENYSTSEKIKEMFGLPMHEPLLGGNCRLSGHVPMADVSRINRISLLSTQIGDFTRMVVPDYTQLVFLCIITQ